MRFFINIEIIDFKIFVCVVYFEKKIFKFLFWLIFFLFYELYISVKVWKYKFNNFINVRLCSYNVLDSSIFNIFWVWFFYLIKVNF